MGNLLEILLLGAITGNTSAAAHAAAMPEFAKEANWLAQGFYQQIRKKSKAPRFYLNTGMILINGFLIYTHNGFKDSWWPIIVLLVSWTLITSYFQVSAKNKASRQAWNIVQSKIRKEETIRDTMYSAAQTRRQLAH